MAAMFWDTLRMLIATRYVHFFIVGVTGVALNLGVTVGLTELVFGRENYFSAYLIGLSIGLLYNFGLHTFVTFKTTRNHMLRLGLFLLYSLALASIQAQVVRRLTDWVGVDWYALVIASVIMVFSVVTFVIFKLFLFKEKNSSGSDITTQASNAR